MISLDRYNGSYNTLDYSSASTCVLNLKKRVIENQNWDGRKCRFEFKK